MTTPSIAVPAYRFSPGRVAGWSGGAFAVPEAYVRAARWAGAIPLAVMEADPEVALQVLDTVDGLMLLGGGDLDPALYGAERHPEVYGVDRDRDDVEMAMVRAAIERGMPVLAICRGIQVVNVAFGGSLVQHLADQPGLLPHGVPGGGTPVMHDVKVSPESGLALVTGTETLSCSSHHHQAVDRLGEGLVVTARTDDGVIEALEHEEAPGWTIAVQWHPEDTAADDPAQQALFDTLAHHARDFADRRPV